ncbi:Kinesin-like protein KIF6 [Tritrichomonas foetus]|uniref:Kinesin-like protein n=1 Tax=Tritrichomonas foetus TaxID=1144522 RepID=A0A1J4KC91_9EUKA|nr:Kinesin-like protein KIF6 [Tritrichomonas foetus]|eukprot:OHT07077.1 Kinesin-like protein KIF6 [Tritrichomonas foetus]
MAKTMNIQVVARVRACFEPSEDYQGFHINEIGDNGIRIEVKPGQKFGWITNPKPHYEFGFSKLYWKDSKQEQIFQNVAMPIITHALDGFNATLFAYGQTGSGKTYTLSGGDTYDERGIIPRSISYLFQKIRQDTSFTYTVFVSYIEIYNNIAYDLLSSGEEQRDRSLDKLKKVQIIDDVNNGGSVLLMHEDRDQNSAKKSNPYHKCADDEEAFMFLFLGETNRAIAATQSNDVSSRSHCILTLTIECRDLSSGQLRTSKLNFVDLAGSERVENLGEEQSRIREAKYINQSLYFLHQVIEKLKVGSDFVPYRDSKMTLYLKDSLGGNCMTTMIATLSSKTSHIHETISTCNFAMTVMTIKNSAKMNISTDPQVLIKRLREEINRLKHELAVARGEENEEAITPEEAERLKKYVRDFMSGQNEMPSLSKKRIEYCWEYVRTHGFSDKQAAAQLVEIDDDDPNKSGTKVESAQNSPQKLMSDPELRKAASKLARKLQRREAEISVLVGMLNQSKNRLNAYVQTNIDEDDTAQEEIQPPPSKEEKEEAWRKFRQNHPKYSAIIANQKTYEDKIKSAKTIGAQAKALKARVEESKARLSQRLNEVEGKDYESDPVLIELRSSILSDTNQYTKMVNDLQSLKAEVTTIQTLIKQLKKQIQGDFIDFWMGHIKPSQRKAETSVQFQIPQQGNIQQQHHHQSRQQAAVAPAPAPPMQVPSGRRTPIESTGDEQADEAILQFEKQKADFLQKAEAARRSRSQNH